MFPVREFFSSSDFFTEVDRNEICYSVGTAGGVYQWFGQQGCFEIADSFMVVFP
jgi:hypothetical protein